MTKKVSSRLFLTIGTAVLIVFTVFVPALLSADSHLQFEASVDKRTLSPTIEQAAIQGGAPWRAMELLDQLMPQSALELGLSADNFEKQQIKGGTYYYEARKEGKLLRLELDPIQNTVGFFTFTLFQVQDDAEQPDFGTYQQLNHYKISST